MKLKGGGGEKCLHKSFQWLSDSESFIDHICEESRSVSVFPAAFFARVERDCRLARQHGVSPALMKHEKFSSTLPTNTKSIS